MVVRFVGGNAFVADLVVCFGEGRVGGVGGGVVRLGGVDVSDDVDLHRRGGRC